MRPAVDKATVEKMMDECDALGDKKFVAKYGMSLQNVRYRVVRGSKRYPSKAVANATYKTLRGEDGPYGGTGVRNVLAALGYEVLDGQDGAEEDEWSPT